MKYALMPISQSYSQQIIKDVERLVTDQYVVPTQQLLGRTAKQCRTSVRTVGILAEILIWYVLYTNQKLFLSVPLPPSMFQSINFQHSIYCPSRVE
jgi:hypothetical protein